MVVPTLLIVLGLVYIVIAAKSDSSACMVAGLIWIFGGLAWIASA
jgi:hypothetical protein